MNILITGASGFIGRNLKEQLKCKYNLFTPSHSELDLLNYNSVKEYLEKNSIEIIINCASVGAKGLKGGKVGTIAQQPEIVSLNLKMFFNILSNLNGRRLISFGSGAEYDKSKDISRVKEEDFGKSIPNEDYGFSKYVISKCIENSKEQVTHLRFFAVYGKYEEYRTRFISRAICRNLLGLPIIIRQNALFDYLYIEDVAKIIEYFISHPEKEKFYNIGSGIPIDLLSIAKIINEISGKKVEIIVENQGMNNEYTCDISRLKKEININYTSLWQGIKELYEYYKGNIDNLDLENLR